MERLAYDPNNCRLLCVDCHIKTHREMRSATRESHKETEANRLERWIDTHIKKQDNEHNT
jgi:5-methylcytosine-specific restriction endonuclease McrA